MLQPEGCQFRMRKSLSVTKKWAIERARCVAQEPFDDARLVFWTDASMSRGSVGWAAVFREDRTWVRIMARGSGGDSSHIAELQAIDLALDCTIQLVEKKTENGKGRLQVLEVYSDCQAALLCLRKAKTIKSQVTQKIALEMGRKVIKLQEVGVYAEFHWVPRNKAIGNILADKGAGLARMGVGCDCTLNNALIEFLPADPVGEGDDNEKSVCLDHVYATVPQKHMAEEITSTLRERAATVKEILAEMAREAAKEKEREATWQRLAEAEPERPEVGIDWHSDIFAIDPELYLPLPEEITETTGGETVDFIGQSPEVENDWGNDILLIDPQLYLPLPEDMTGVVTSKVAAEGATDTCTGE